MSEYYADQNRCKLCFSDSKALMRTAESQGCKKEVVDLRDKDPQAFAELQKAFSKTREDNRKLNRKMKFNVATFIKDYEKRKGFRDSRLGEMMWLQEWLEFAAAAKCGYLTKEEAKLEWDKMLAETWRPQDDAGPRGFKRVWIKTKDQGEVYSDVSSGIRFQQEEHLKKPSDQILQRIGSVFGDTIDEQGVIDFDMVSKEAMRASGNGEGLSGMMQEELQPMIQAAERKTAAGKKGPCGKGLLQKPAEDQRARRMLTAMAAAGRMMTRMTMTRPAAERGEPSKRRRTAVGKAKATGKKAWFDAPQSGWEGAVSVLLTRPCSMPDGQRSVESRWSEHVTRSWQLAF